MSTNPSLLPAALLALVPAGDAACRGVPTLPGAASREELQTFDPAEVGWGPAESDRAGRSAPGSPLQWTCRLDAKVLLAGDPLSAEVTVRNPSADTAYRLSPPAGGVLVGHAQGWYRRAGGDKFRPLGRWKRYPGRRGAVGVPVRLGPGEVRRWVTRLNAEADVIGGRGSGDRLPVTEFALLGSVGLTEPGTYEVLVRYVNLEPEWGWPNEKLPATKLDLRDRDQPLPDRVRLFGPDRVTVVERPGGRPDWAADACKLWAGLVPDGSDVRRGPAGPVADRLDGLTDAQLRQAGEMGLDVRLWRLARHWPLVRRSEREADEFLERLRAATVGLAADDPRRGTAELLRVATLIERGKDAEVLAAGLGASNPDVAVLVGLWIEERLSKR